MVLALGLLVDDVIIAVEMMAIKMEQGYDRLEAASFAWTSTAFPMLTGTLDYGGRFPADCHCAIEHRRIHPFDFPGGDHRVAGLVGRRGGVRAIPGKLCRTWRKFTQPNMALRARIPTERRSTSA